MAWLNCSKESPGDDELQPQLYASVGEITGTSSSYTLLPRAGVHTGIPNILVFFFLEARILDFYSKSLVFFKNYSSQRKQEWAAINTQAHCLHSTGICS